MAEPKLEQNDGQKTLQPVSSADKKLTSEHHKGLCAFYYHPLFQICMLGFVCFMCPGMFNALSGLGGGGQVDARTASNANTALYSTFAFFSFFAGSINNTLGPRNTLMIGTVGYALFVGSFLADNIHPTTAGPFVVAAGAILGICAAFLWTAQGSLVLSYPTEAEKGKYIGVFWAIFNLGGVVGAAVSLGQNFNSEANQVGNGTYIGFLILTLIGVAIPRLMADPKKMIRTDGTKVETYLHPSWKAEIYRLWLALRTDPMILMLFPMFYASNYFYTWQFNDYNQALFDIRARSLNNFVYWLSQIVGSLAIGTLVLDQVRFPRRTRAFAGWTILLAMVFVVNAWGYSYQKTYTRESVALLTRKMDIHDPGYVGRVWLMIFCGLFDAMWQTTAYWLMGAMSNDPSKLAVFTGFYKSIQSAGAAGVWRADAVGIPYMNIFLSSWCLTAGGLAFALPMIYLRVKNHTELEEETLAPVAEMSETKSGAEV
ncbi:major facilitator superfamily domain-containing protein [Pisolithus thermaeus]|nr:major facilitator superfamily domain-containing protein [Pisolithus croceorrhizus]KAI6136222.1 major facilitator superfamily domain-containing protein [Pisolithus sp. B1]KAI6163743.1 major facilitator superfamily domain-containing protein [Pisolithus thermaeus]